VLRNLIQKPTFRKIAALLLIIVLSVLVILSIPSIVMVLWQELQKVPVWFMTVDKIRVVLDLVLWILIVIELADSIRVYLEEKGLHLETVISISIIAMARKIIAVKLRDYEPVMVLGMAALLIALGVIYYLIRKVNSQQKGE